ncbi:hypothetical protein EV182_001859, partial [Spiromyces aspiralis]
VPTFASAGRRPNRQRTTKNKYHGLKLLRGCLDAGNKECQSDTHCAAFASYTIERIDRELEELERRSGSFEYAAGLQQQQLHRQQSTGNVASMGVGGADSSPISLGLAFTGAPGTRLEQGIAKAAFSVASANAQMLGGTMRHQLATTTASVVHTKARVTPGYQKLMAAHGFDLDFVKI